MLALLTPNLSKYSLTFCISTCTVLFLFMIHSSVIYFKFWGKIHYSWLPNGWHFVPTTFSVFFIFFFADLKCHFWSKLSQKLFFCLKTSIHWLVCRSTVLHTSSCATFMLFLTWWVYLVDRFSNDVSIAIYFHLSTRLHLSGLIFYYHLIIWSNVRKICMKWINKHEFQLSYFKS